MRATYSPSTRGMHHMSLRHGLRSFSDNRRRTVSPDRLSCLVSWTIASAKRSSVQRARPSGGLAQAVATSRASSLPVSLRSAPGRGSSLSARFRLPSTKRRLVRYTVEPLTATVRAISSSLQPASVASNIWARLSLRAVRLPPRNIAVSSQRSAWFSSTRYRTFISASFSEASGTNRRMSQKSGAMRREPRFTEKQGQYLAFIYSYSHMFRNAPAEADMQRHFRVSPPSVHQMVLTLERAGFIRRQPGVARSIELLIDPQALPILDWLEINPSKPL